MPTLPDHLRLPLTRRYQQALLDVGNRTTPAIQRAWDALPAYDKAQIGEFTSATSAQFQAVKTVTVRTSTGFYSTVSGRPAPRILLTDIDIEPAIGDPFIAVWRAFKEGRPYDEAVAAGRSRVDAIVANYTNSTARQIGDTFVAKSGAKHQGWERIPDPGACDWCHLVAGQTYASADSADFGHDRCACTAIPKF